MENPKFIDNDLRQVFRSEDTFSVAQNINGKVFREYENRITKPHDGKKERVQASCPGCSIGK